jgi:hypothetical protein
MTRRTPIVLMAVLVVACSPAEQMGTTTTSSLATTTTTASTLPPTTTSTTSTTTTTVPPTTTTTLLEGNWAEHPVITSAIMNMTLGWWDGSTWVQAEEGMSLPISGGEDYQVALLGAEPAITTGGDQVAGCDILFPSDFPGIELAERDLLSHPLQPGEQSALDGVAISAGWELTPHHVATGEAHPDLEAVGIELLADRGFQTASTQIVQTVDANLDGGEFIESIVVIEETELGNEGSDVYSLMFVMTATGDPVVIEESVIPADQTGFPASFRVGAVADLNGDGVMEVVLDGLAWENSWVTVYELVDDGFVERIGAGCGV